MRFITLLLALTNCGQNVCEQPYDFEVNGMCVYTNGKDITKETLEYVVDVAEQTVTDRLGFSRNEMRHLNNNTVIHFVDYVSKMNDGETQAKRSWDHIDFDAVDSISMYVEYNEDIAFSSFPHELLHAIRYNLYGLDHVTHPRNWFCDYDDCSENPIEEKIYTAINNNRL